MSESVGDGTPNAVGSTADKPKRRTGRPRVHESDAARKRAFNQRRAQAHARARAAERRAKRCEAKARELRTDLELLQRRFRTARLRNDEREAQLRAKIARLEEQLDHAINRKKWAVGRTTSAIAEARQLRERLARAERAVRAYGGDDRLDKLELKARVRQLEEWLMRGAR
jgi:hypothetical protein